MKRTFALVLFFLIVATSGQAQFRSPKSFQRTNRSSSSMWQYRRWEMMFGVGTSQIYGDIGGFSQGENALGFKDFSFKNLRFSANAGMRYWINERFAARVNLGFAGLHASDSKGSNEGRTFESSTMLFEPSLLGEYDIIKAKYESMYLFKRGAKNLLSSLIYTFNIYGYAGIGGSMFKVNINEGVGYSGTTSDGGFAAVIPVGIGVRMQYNSRISFGIEWSNRFAISDYIDGYTSEFSNHNDMYRFFNFTYCYKLRTGKHGGPSFRGAGSGS
jgi:opacity protein-like surface antigen